MSADSSFSFELSRLKCLRDGTNAEISRGFNELSCHFVNVDVANMFNCNYIVRFLANVLFILLLFFAMFLC